MGSDERLSNRHQDIRINRTTTDEQHIHCHRLQASDIPGRFLRIDEELRASGASNESVNKMSVLINEIVTLALKS